MHQKPQQHAMRHNANLLSILHPILFLGRRNDVPDLMAAADVFCLPSFFEGHPLVIMEAMAAGLPVVGTRSLGITDTVQNGASGLLVPVDNAGVLAAALARILNDSALAARLAEAGRAVAHHRFSAERMARDTVGVYREALKAAQGLSAAENSLSRPQPAQQIRSAGPRLAGLTAAPVHKELRLSHPAIAETGPGTRSC